MGTCLIISPGLLESKDINAAMMSIRPAAPFIQIHHQVPRLSTALSIYNRYVEYTKANYSYVFPPLSLSTYNTLYIFS